MLDHYGQFISAISRDRMSRSEIQLVGLAERECGTEEGLALAEEE
jgi:hypothetical protein